MSGETGKRAGTRSKKGTGTRRRAGPGSAGRGPGPTFESVWAAIDKLVEAQKKVAETQGKAAEEAAEERRKTEEERRKTEEERRKTEEARRETEASIKSLGEHVRELTEDLKEANGNFNNKWGRFMENLVEGDFLAVLKERGFGVKNVTPRMKSIDEDRKTVAEYDLVARDGGVVVVAEVKTTLWREDVEEFLEKLARFKMHFPEFQGRRVLGAVAFMAVADEKDKKKKKKRRAADGQRAAGKKKPADELARDAGLFAIRSPGGAPGLAVVENPPDFEPKEF